jgi:hypothetical protein
MSVDRADEHPQISQKKHPQTTQRTQNKILKGIARSAFSADRSASSADGFPRAL